LRGRSVHGVDVGEIDNRRLVTEVLEGYIFEVEVYAFEQEVSGDKGAFVLMVKDGCIVSNALLGGGLKVLNVFGEVADESELA
jgi:hypothetical protein